MLLVFSFLLSCLLLFLFCVELNATTNCKRLIPQVKSASEFVLGINFPWWYNLGQLETESNCIWRTSLDGWGSIGYAQITPRFWDRVLQQHFPNWKTKEHQDHFLAQAYIVKEYLQQAYCKKLWNVYQCYNRSCGKVNLEAKRANCNYNKAFDICLENPQPICVWKRPDGSCRQWRSSCDINYSYGLKVYQNGRKYNPGIIEKIYTFF